MPSLLQPLAYVAKALATGRDEVSANGSEVSDTLGSAVSCEDDDWYLVDGEGSHFDPIKGSQESSESNGRGTEKRGQGEGFSCLAPKERHTDEGQNQRQNQARGRSGAASYCAKRGG
jgi:hypothetical protein